MKPKIIENLGTLFMFAMLAMFVACTPQQAQKPDVVVYGVKGGYEASLVTMTAYAKLPRCAPAAPPLCSQQAVVDQLERARVTARAAIDAAEGAVRTPGFGTDATTTALAAAEGAQKALAAITTPLKVK